MIDLAARETRALELMDDPDCDQAALQRTYRDFAVVNRLVSGWGAVYRSRIRPLLRATGRPLTLLDVGCGGGDVAVALAARARRDGLRLEVTGIDPDPRAHAFAAARPPQPGLAFERATSRDFVDDGRHFDVVVSNHVLHHLDADAFAGVMRDSETLADRLVLHSDIARGRLAYAAFSAATAVTFPGSFIHADGRLSIRRSYRADELRRVAPPGWRIERPVPFRLLLTWRPSPAEAADA